MPHLENEYLRLALKASGIGTWRYNPLRRDLIPDATALGLLGQVDTHVYKADDLLSHVLHEDREAVTQLFLNNDKEIALSFRVLSEGVIKWLYVKGERHSRTKYFGTIQDITNEMRGRMDVEQSERRFRSIIEESPIATCLFVGKEMRIEVANDIMLSYWGKDYSVFGMPLVEALPELVGQPFLDILDRVYTTGIAHSDIEAEAQLVQNGLLVTRYFDYTYKPLKDERGNVYAIMDVAVDVTHKVLSDRKLRRSEKRFRTIVEQSPVAIGLLKGKDMVIETGNDLIFNFWGKKRSVTGKPLIEALPEIEGQEFINLLNEVYTSGKAHHGFDTLAKLEHNGELQDRYFDFSYSPLRDENNKITGVLVLANDVTARRENMIKLAESEEKFRTVLNSAPAAMAVFKGRDLVIDVANKAFLEAIDRGENILGKHLFDVMPEIIGQKSIDLIHQVFDTGEKIHSYGRQVNIMRKGFLTSSYYNVSYSPIFDIDGNVDAVLDVAIDVTETIKARQAIEEAEAALRGAIELAELGTWSMDPVTGLVQYSDRIRDWFGLGEGSLTTMERVLEAIHPKDRFRVAEAVTASTVPSGSGVYDAEYTVVNLITGRERILHAQGKTFFNPDGSAYLLSGTAHDITSHRELQTALENEVKARTEELRRTLSELEEANNRLISSNEELAQYAYVASHDLQEPLRKISMFSKLLKERDENGQFDIITGKIIQSSDRMSQLIRDLLEFSRLLKQDSGFVMGDLNTIVEAVKHDFELLIEEKMARVNIDPLPEIECVPLQMNQLFYNLLGNALKFVLPGRDPEINVYCEIISKEEAAEQMAVVYDTVYYRLTVKDNGIGIEEKYTKQIFEVFKRLHARDEYSGSGIGLAICRRIVNNHKGAIYIDSTPGAGTSFHIILPERQI